MRTRTQKLNWSAVASQEPNKDSNISFYIKEVGRGFLMLDQSSSWDYRKPSRFSIEGWTNAPSRLAKNTCPVPQRDGLGLAERLAYIAMSLKARPAGRAHNRHSADSRFLHARWLLHRGSLTPATRLYKTIVITSWYTKDTNLSFIEEAPAACFSARSKTITAQRNFVEGRLLVTKLFATLSIKVERLSKIKNRKRCFTVIASSIDRKICAPRRLRIHFNFSGGNLHS